MGLDFRRNTRYRQLRWGGAFTGFVVGEIILFYDLSRTRLREMKRTLPLLICLAHLFIPIAVTSQKPLSESSRKQKNDSPAVNALWITVVPAFKDFGSDKRPQSSYFDLQSDGRFVFAEGD